MGYQPLTPNAIAATYGGSNPFAYKLAREWHEEADLTRARLDKAAKRMKKWVDEKRRLGEYSARDLVMVKRFPNPFNSLRQVHKGLVRRYEGPFLIVKRVGATAY